MVTYVVQRARGISPHHPWHVDDPVAKQTTNFITTAYNDINNDINNNNGGWWKGNDDKVNGQ